MSTGPEHGAYDPQAAAADIPAVPVAVGHDLNTQQQAADYGGWTLYRLAGTEAPQLILPYDGSRHRATIMASPPASPGGTSQGIVSVQSGNAPVTNPGALATIASISAATLGAAAPAGSLWQVSWTASPQGTLTATDANNMQLVSNLQTKQVGIYPGVPGNYPQTPIYLVIPSGAGLTVQSIGASSGASAVYGAQIVATLVPPAAGPFVYLGSQAQCLQKLGGILAAGQSVVVENNQQLWMVPDGTDPVNVSVLAERWDSPPG